MKFEDGPLKSYLIKNLQPLTAADPSLLANYVLALLKNNKPKDDLQKLCVDKLFDFLGDGTKEFVAKLFHDLEGDSLVEAAEGSIVPPTGDGTTEPKPPSPVHVTRTIPSAIQVNNNLEDSSDDEDDDRNHKHRRRVSRSRSFDRDAEESERNHHRKRSRSTENGQYKDNHRHYEHRRSYRGRDNLSSRIVVDGGVHGGTMRGGHLFRDAGGARFFGPGLQRNIGTSSRGSWLPPDQRFGGAFASDFPPALLGQGPSTSNLFPGRIPGGRGGPAAQGPWGTFGLLENGALDVLPLNARGNSLNPLTMITRTRCLDFEERGYCLRGDLCPMEHGANRIVVEDVQSLSKLTLPMANARNGGVAAGAPEKGARPSRESIAGDDGNAGSAVSDSYDPDQPLWGGKDQPDKVRQYHSERQWENASDARELGGDDKTGDTSKGEGVSVWDRIGPVEGEKGSNKRPRLTGPEEGHGNVADNGGEKQSQSQRNAVGTSYGGTGDRAEKAQRTLYVRCIPTDSNKADILRGHFQKFGKVLDIRIPTIWKDRAFVQFYERESAEAALASPDAVLGNRFILLDWANRDNRPVPYPAYDYHRSKTSSTAPAVANGTTTTTAITTSSPAPEAKKQSPATNGVAAQMQKKQEELEQMKEEIRKKQEALAAKRDEFKRKLEKLGKQGVSLPVSESESQPSEEPKAVASPPLRPGPGQQQFNKAALSWGPYRYKIDNRPTGFKVLTPPPAALSDLAAMKEHFGSLGEVSEIEVVDDGSAIKVSFSSRRDAEKAFSQGKLWQGQSLQLVWLMSPAVLDTSSSAAATAPLPQQQVAGGATQ